MKIRINNVPEHSMSQNYILVKMVDSPKDDVVEFWYERYGESFGELMESVNYLVKNSSCVITTQIFSTDWIRAFATETKQYSDVFCFTI